MVGTQLVSHSDHFYLPESPVSQLLLVLATNGSQLTPFSDDLPKPGATSSRGHVLFPSQDSLLLTTPGCQEDSKKLVCLPKGEANSEVHC